MIKDEFKELVKKLNKEDKFFAAIEEWMVPYIAAGRKIVWDVKTSRYVLPDNVELQKASTDVLPLNAKDAKYIHQYSIYNEYVDSNYLRDRIYKGFSAGVIENGKPVAWVLTQDDGALNFLYVMKEHRRKGLANTVISALIEKIRNSGRKPYMYIDDTRDETIQLAVNLGFIKEKNCSLVQSCIIILFDKELITTNPEIDASISEIILHNSRILALFQ